MMFTIKRHQAALKLGTSLASRCAHGMFAMTDAERADQAAVRRWAGSIVRLFEKAAADASRRLPAKAG